MRHLLFGSEVSSSPQKSPGTLFITRTDSNYDAWICKNPQCVTSKEEGISNRVHRGGSSPFRCTAHCSVCHCVSICGNYERHLSIVAVTQRGVSAPACAEVAQRRCGFFPQQGDDTAVWRANAEWLVHSHFISLIMQLNRADEEICSMEI